jgi:nucleoside-diphosphate-sugar epimerase
MLKKKILITGVAGFIGSNLAERLILEGYDVVGIDNLSNGPLEQVPSGVRFFKVDIVSDNLDKIFDGIDIIFHFAAKNCISDCQASPVDTALNNVMGTVRVFEAAKKNGCSKVIYAESSAIYEGSKIFPTPEREECPESFYACSKMATKYFAEAYRRYHSLETTALRYFCVYGPRQDYRRSIPPVMSAFIINLLRGIEPVIYGSGEKRRDFIYIDDINDFHIKCIDDVRTNGKTFNLGSGVNYSIKQVYGAISENLGVKVDVRYKENLEGESEITLADITLARELGWRPAVTLDEGLRRSIKYIKENVIL